jgi:hypothetical protein
MPPSFAGPASRTRRGVPPALRWGVPMVLFCVGGYLGLSSVSERATDRLSAELWPWRLTRRRGQCPTVTFMVVRPARGRPQFQTGRVDAADKRVRKTSERAVELEKLHKVRAATAAAHRTPASSETWL